MSSSLLLTRRFAPLFWCQFFSAFNDNFLKNALVFLISVPASAASDAERAGARSPAAVFIAPVLLSVRAGRRMADRYDKAVVARRLKFAEIARRRPRRRSASGMHSVPMLFVALFCFGVIAALFGPIKYGILPDHLAQRRAAGRQRAGRRRDLHRHPARHHRRRPRRQGRRRSRPRFAALMIVFALAVLGRRAC